MIAYINLLMNSTNKSKRCRIEQSQTRLEKFPSTLPSARKIGEKLFQNKINEWNRVYLPRKRVRFEAEHQVISYSTYNFEKSDPDSDVSHGFDCYKSLTNDGTQLLNIPLPEIGVDSDEDIIRYCCLSSYFNTLIRFPHTSVHIKRAIAHREIRLIVKLCDVEKSNEMDRMYCEDAQYDNMSTLQGTYIPKVVFYGHLDFNKSMAIIMSDEGTSLDQIASVVALSEHVRHTAVTALQAVHNVVVLYQNISLKHMLLSVDGTHIKLIDFSVSSRFSNDDMLFAEEIKSLQLLLGLPVYHM